MAINTNMIRITTLGPWCHQASTRHMYQRNHAGNNFHGHLDSFDKNHNFQSGHRKPTMSPTLMSGTLLPTRFARPCNLMTDYEWIFWYFPTLQLSVWRSDAMNDSEGRHTPEIMWTSDPQTPQWVISISTSSSVHCFGLKERRLKSVQCSWD